MRPLVHDVLELLRDEIVEVHQLARDQEGKMLVWTGEPVAASAPVSLSTPVPARTPCVGTAGVTAVTRGAEGRWDAIIVLSSIPFCPYNGRKGSLRYLPAVARDMTFQGNTTIFGTHLCLVRSVSCAATISPHAEACKAPRATDQHTHTVDFPMMEDHLPRSTRMELHTRVALIDTLLEEADQKMQALQHALAAQERAKDEIQHAGHDTPLS
jgi:hypothetical protein